MLKKLTIVVLCSVFFGSCAAKRSNDIIGVSGEEFGIVGVHINACDIPKGYTYISPRVMDEVVGAGIEDL
jgi:hypothetical protein